MASLYTRKGDQGQTVLTDGEKISKGDIQVECYGTLDELKSYIGLSMAFITEDGLAKELQYIQERLFILGGILAHSKLVSIKAENQITAGDIRKLEQWIDQKLAAMPPIRHFVGISTHKGSAVLDVARSICRRCERSLVRMLEQKSIEVDSNVHAFLNRLSDYLFAASCWIRYVEKEE